jgi:hypothetical protein
VRLSAVKNINHLFFCTFREILTPEQASEAESSPRRAGASEFPSTGRFGRTYQGFQRPRFYRNGG